MGRQSFGMLRRGTTDRRNDKAEGHSELTVWRLKGILKLTIWRLKALYMLTALVKNCLLTTFACISE